MKMFRAVGAITLVAASAICMAASGGCGTSLHKAEVSAGAIAASLHTAATTNHNSTLETADEKAMVATYIKDAAAADSDFIGVLRSAEANGGTPNAAAITTAFSSLVSKINDLNTQGVLHLKSTQAQADFQLAIAGIQAEIATLQTLYPSTSAKASSVKGWGGLASAAVVFTGAEIEELIALAISAASSLVPKLEALKGESGTAILDAADADVEDAESIADEDIAADAPAPAGGTPPAA